MVKILSGKLISIWNNFRISEAQEVRFDFTDQVSCCVRVILISEGISDKTIKTLLNFIVAFDSNYKQETQMMFSGDLDDINRGKVKVIMDKIDEIKRMINVLIKSLKNRHLNPRILDHFLSTNWEKNLQ